MLASPLPEVAIVGRSNVGKSSLLNALASGRIARVSRTPGKTRALNVYAVDGRGMLRPYYLLDLPGYGYARAGKADRVAFRRLVAHALARPRLVGVVWLLDIRREPSAEDRAMQDLLAERGTSVLAALTKSDKLPFSRRLRRGKEVQEAFSLDPNQVLVTSALTGEGVAELREAIEHLVQGARDEGRGTGDG